MRLLLLITYYSAMLQRTGQPAGSSRGTRGRCAGISNDLSSIGQILKEMKGTNDP